jgi:integrase/recombinase XerC
MARLRQRGNSFEIDYYVDGKRKKKCFKDRDEAERVYNQLQMKELKRSMGIESESLLVEKKLNEAIREYFKLRSEKKASKGNDTGYFERLYDFLHVQKGLVYLDEITPLHVEEYQSFRRSQVANSTVNREFHTLRSFFKKCVEWRYLKESPVKVANLKEKENPYQQWLPEEAQAMIDCLPEWASDVFYFIGESGCRPCEARRLEWNHVSFAQAILKFETDKSANGVRYFPASEELLDFLSQQRKKSGDSNFVFTFNGDHISKDHLEKTVKRTREELGLSDKLSMYGLRHAFGTKLASKNVNQEKVRRLMGHTSLKTTQRYTNLNMTDLREEVGLGSMFKTN